ncbi:MAG: prolipoprotein diacylglyceryl transferase [Thermoanaerobaculaceae bacterium]|jgi:phosphatidylglycerol:prolipoprotein diacylglycerol transferase|nr:prolipoprotein diacylglyceryl transferase [Thermoanaerobaculaceae bacterium]
MHPTLHLGPLAVSSWGFFHALAMTVAGYLAYARLLRAGIPLRDALAGTLACLVAGVAGAGAIHWAVQAALSRAGDSPGLQDGSSVIGAMVLVPLACVLYFGLRRLPVGAACDAVAGAAPLGQAIGRIGCLLGGCCHGRPSQGWLAMDLPDTRGAWCPRYPTQLMSSLADLAIFATVMLVERRLRKTGRGFPGAIALVFLGLYCCKRFGMEFLREEHPLVLGGLSWAHAASLAGLVTVLAVTAVLASRRRTG